MTYTVTVTPISGLLVLEAEEYKDERGSFSETFNKREFNKIVESNVEFVQDNVSVSRKNVLRGMHLQTKTPQSKLIRVNKGSIFDVAIDLRSDSKTFGSWYSTLITADSKIQLWIPDGFAHGFLALEDDTEVFYKVTGFYEPESEISLMWNDPDLAIMWPKVENIILSKKDRNALSFSDYCRNFKC